VYFRQRLPRDYLNVSVGWIDAEITVLVKQQLIVDKGDFFELTSLGRTSLLRMSRGRRPKMISMKQEIFFKPKEGSDFIVGRALAEEIFREVSFND
jgi:hypothetical protein